MIPCSAIETTSTELFVYFFLQTPCVNPTVRWDHRWLWRLLVAELGTRGFSSVVFPVNVTLSSISLVSVCFSELQKWWLPSQVREVVTCVREIKQPWRLCGLVSSRQAHRVLFRAVFPDLRRMSDVCVYSILFWNRIPLATLKFFFPNFIQAAVVWNSSHFISYQIFWKWNCGVLMIIWGIPHWQ